MKNKTVLMALSGIMSFRMLGLFMILPVFSIYATQFHHTTATLIGLALGIYGLMQACFQIPLGMLSDRIGRKRVILAGLVLFFIGSIIAACAHSIYALIAGRAIQGAGAIGSTVLALVADVTPEASRGKAMAFIGLAIGLSFTVAMILGPIINHYFQLKGIFWFTAILALAGIVLVLFAIPKVNAHPPESTTAQGDKRTAINTVVLHNPQLLRFDFGIFALHAILTALFIVIPIILSNELSLPSQSQIILYSIVLLLAFVFALPFIIVAEKYRKMRLVFTGAITLMFAVLMTITISAKTHADLALFSGLLLAFFTAFTVLEALLPSLVSKAVSPNNKGAAMGIYSACQFLGIFVGGAAGGLVFAYADMLGVFAMCTGLAGCWLLSTVLHHPTRAGSLT